MEKECEACGVIFRAAKARIRTCSIECGGIIRQRRGTIGRTCPVCDTVYQADPVRLRHGRQTTCSRACSYRLRSAPRVKRQPCVCATCGHQMERKPSQIKAKHGASFCSRECHYAGRRLGLVRPRGQPYTQTEQGVMAKRKAGALAYASGESIEWPEIEYQIAAALRDAGHVVIQQHILTDSTHWWPVDLFIPAMLTIIEIDGPSHDRADRAARDAMVDKTAAAIGLHVIRVRDGAPEQVKQAVFRALAARSV